LEEGDDGNVFKESRDHPKAVALTTSFFCRDRTAISFTMFTLALDLTVNTGVLSTWKQPLTP
jgi:hypothetical protein